MPTTDPREIAILTTEVRHLTDAVKKLLEDMEGHRALLQKKASVAEVQDLRVDLTRAEERISTLQQSSVRLDTIEIRLSKVEMETWKLGLMLGGSATGGGILALIAQYLLGLVIG